MEAIYNELFKLLNDSHIEKLLKIIILTSDMCENDKKMIELLIQNDKNMNFKRVKYIFMLELIANFGFFADRVNDRQVFKIVTSVITIYNKKYTAEIYREIEKQTILNLEKFCFQKFNSNTASIILKNTEKNKNIDNSLIQNIYLDSYNNILIIFELYTIVVQKTFNFITELALLILTPVFFERRHGLIRNILNIFLSIGHIVFEFFYIFKDSSTNNNEDDDNDISTCESEVKNNIIGLFRNLTIIIEKDTLKQELNNTLHNINTLLRNNNFRKKYESTNTSKNGIKLFTKYKIIETLMSTIINDAYIFNLSSISEGAMISLGDKLIELNKKLPLTREFVNILHEDSYHTRKTILWNNTSRNIFTLENVTIEYEEFGGIFNTVLENVYLNFEIEKSHLIYGNSGSGKTTLSNALMQRIKLKSGSIYFFGLNYTYFSIRNYLSYLTSESAIFPKSLYYNIVYGFNKNTLLEKKNEIIEKIIEYMKLFDLEQFIQNIKTKKAINLSKGQTQRVAIIRLFINIIFNGIKILFLDEFTSNIDNAMEITIFTELKNLQKTYRFTLFYISHNLYNKKYADYIYEINNTTRTISKKTNTDYECIDDK